ncbi:MAG: Sua5/YciO/YrdC/YwlC family protein, partial [Bacteroidota bacterium]
PRIETLLSHHQQPLTLIHDHPIEIPDYLLTPEQTIGIRICKDPYCRDLINTFGKPIVSTSANLSGDPFPKHFGEISDHIKSEVDYIVSIRNDEYEPAQPSVVARYNHKGDLEFLRR